MGYIINLSKVVELEKEYEKSEIALAAFQNMIIIVSSEECSEEGVIIETLKDLGVLIEK
jgi:hypothetical protein